MEIGERNRGGKKKKGERGGEIREGRGRTPTAFWTNRTLPLTRVSAREPRWRLNIQTHVI